MNSIPRKGESLLILLVEDNQAHARLVMRSFEDHRIANLIHHLVDGEAALDYLFRRGIYSDPAQSPRPHLILLDLRLPKINGLEVLKEVKADPEVKNIPIVVLTTSAAEQDVARAYEYHANSYLVKPVEFTQFTQMMAELGFYWLGWNQHPYS